MVGSDGVVIVGEMVEEFVEVAEGSDGPVGVKELDQGLMESLILALGLRMLGTSGHRFDTKVE